MNPAAGEDGPRHGRELMNLLLIRWGSWRVCREFEISGKYQTSRHFSLCVIRSTAARRRDITHRSTLFKIYKDTHSCNVITVTEILGW